MDNKSARELCENLCRGAPYPPPHLCPPPQGGRMDFARGCRVTPRRKARRAKKRRLSRLFFRALPRLFFRLDLPAFLAALEPFADARLLAGALPELIELRPPHVAAALDLDARDQRGIRLEGALHALAGGDLAHDEGGIEPAVALGDDHALVGLDALAVAFHHADVHDYRVAGRDPGNLFSQPLDFIGLELFDDAHVQAPCASFIYSSSSIRS